MQGKLMEEENISAGSGTIQFNHRKGMYLFSLFDQKSKSVILNGKFIY